MASNSSKAIPYLVLAIVVISLDAEVYLDTSIDLEAYLPLLIPLGVGGAIIKSVKVASNAKKSIDTESLKKTIRTTIQEMKQ